MRRHLLARLSLVGTAIVCAVIGGSMTQSRALAQQQPPAPPQQAPPTAQAQAPIDLTGVWVSVVTEEWRWRMMTPPKGDYASIPITDEARRVGDQWDAAKDTADGNACRAYGAIGIMRIPARYRISWQDPQTLKMEIDAGQQTRIFRFGDEVQRPNGPTDWQGFSMAKWLRPGGADLNQPVGGGFGGGFAGVVGPVGPPGGGRGRGARGNNPPPQQRGGSLKVETANMRPGYLRKNGLPYSENATMTEYFFTHRAPDGNQWLTVQQLVRDSRYLNTEYVSSWHYKKEPDSSKWRSTPCVAS